MVPESLLQGGRLGKVPSKAGQGCSCQGGPPFPPTEAAGLKMGPCLVTNAEGRGAGGVADSEQTGQVTGHTAVGRPVRAH